MITIDRSALQKFFALTNLEPSTRHHCPTSSDGICGVAACAGVTAATDSATTSILIFMRGLNLLIVVHSISIPWLLMGLCLCGYHHFAFGRAARVFRLSRA